MTEAAFPPLPRLTGYDFLVAGALLLAPAFLPWPGGGDPGSGFLLPALGIQAAFALLAWAWLKHRAQPAAPEPRHGLRWVLGVYLVSLPGLFAVAFLNGLLLSGLGVEEEPMQQVVRGMEQAGGWELLPVALLAALGLPFLEELLFRGYLFRFLAGHRAFGPRRALVLSACTFTILHERIVWLPVLYLGLLFGWIYWQTRSVAHAWFAHALHNGTAVTLMLLSRMAAE